MPASPNPLTEIRTALNAVRTEARERYVVQASPSRLFAALTKSVDKALTALWVEQHMPAEAALIAVGGYGRGELYPFSDVDILVLLPEASASDKHIESFVTALWDVGLEIGHSVRTVADCVKEMDADITVATAMLESRFLHGNEELFIEFNQAFDKALDPKTFTRAKLFEQEQRYNRYQDTAYNLEPNIKESPGGLRDLHMIRWLASAGGLPTSWQGMADIGLMSEADATHLAKAEKTEQDLRIRLHWQAGRREDRLVFDVQSQLARGLDFVDTPEKRASEQVMQRYYRAAKVVQQANHVLLAVIEDRLNPTKIAPQVLDGDFELVGDRLGVRFDEAFTENPLTILRAFAVLVSHPDVKAFTPQVRQLLSAARNEIDAKFHKRDDASKLFMSILRAPRGTYHALRAMNHYGVLGRYIPAWAKIVGQMQHDLFHVYTVDEHILMVLRNMRRFVEPQHAHEYPLCSELIAAFEKKELLYLGCLFHDIAKGRGGDHSTLGKEDATAFCLSQGLDEADAALVSWLVEHHLTMSSTAQKQDITDPDVVAKFAKLVGDETHLIALYLLTVADVRGTSPKVWNAWKAKLIEDLFRATRRLLTNGGEAKSFDLLGERMQQAREQLALYAIDPAKAEPFWRTLDSVYLQRHAADEIAWHARNLYFRIDGEPDAKGAGKRDAPIVRTRLAGGNEALQILVYVADQPRLFVRVCGVLGELGFSILDAKIHTTKDGFALDTFTVTHPEHATSAFRNIRQQIEHTLTEALTTQGNSATPFTGRVNRMLKHVTLAPQIHIAPDERGQNLILEIVAADRPGLLYKIADTLAQHSVEIISARVNTLGLRAEDVFIVRGAAIDTEKERVRFETDLVAALS
jgi:[protein-PII] uridylyltransferase